jgi:hypothetical protein
MAIGATALEPVSARREFEVVPATGVIPPVSEPPLTNKPPLPAEGPPAPDGAPLPTEIGGAVVVVTGGAVVVTGGAVVVTGGAVVVVTGGAVVVVVGGAVVVVVGGAVVVVTGGVVVVGVPAGFTMIVAYTATPRLSQVSVALVRVLPSAANRLNWKVNDAGSMRSLLPRSVNLIGLESPAPEITNAPGPAIRC